MIHFRHAEYHTCHAEHHTRHAELVSASLFLISILLLFLSCKTTGTQKPDNLRPVYITNTKKINLLSPEYNEKTLDTLQLFNSIFGETSFSMLSLTQIDSSGISLSLFNDFGTDMGELFFDGKDVSFESAYLPAKLPGEYIVAEIQNAYYDEKVLKENYSRAALSFVSEASGLRKIYDGKKLIEEIFILDEKVKIINYLRGYTLELVNAE